MKNNNDLKIFLDIDDVIFSWGEAYAKRFNTKIPKSWTTSKLMSKRLDQLSKERNFWLNLPVKNVPNFQPAGFLSARGIPKSWTEASLKKNLIPGRSNVNQVGWGESKIAKLKSFGTDIFIDDKPETFHDCWKAGIFCLLMDDHKNQNVKTPYRIYDLDYNVIMGMFHNHRLKL